MDLISAFFSAVVWNTPYENSPAGGNSPSLGDDQFRDLKVAVRERFEKEHTMNTASGTVAGDGQHKPGSGRPYYQASAPTVRPDGATALTSADNGRRWVRTTDMRESVYVHPNWEVVTVLQGADNSFTGDNTFSGDTVFSGDVTFNGDFVNLRSVPDFINPVFAHTMANDAYTSVVETTKSVAYVESNNAYVIGTRHERVILVEEDFYDSVAGSKQIATTTLPPATTNFCVVAYDPVNDHVLAAPRSSSTTVYKLSPTDLSLIGNVTAPTNGGSDIMAMAWDSTRNNLWVVDANKYLTLMNIDTGVSIQTLLCNRLTGTVIRDMMFVPGFDVFYIALLNVDVCVIAGVDSDDDHRTLPEANDGLVLGSHFTGICIRGDNKVMVHYQNYYNEFPLSLCL